MSKTNTTKLTTTMTEERKKEALWFFEQLLNWAQDPEKSIEALESYKKTLPPEDAKLCDWLRDCIYAFSGNTPPSKTTTTTT